MTHPRVLHLGFQPIGSPTNSGLTLASMFGGWPQERLLEVCLKPHPDLPTRPNVVFTPPTVAPIDGVVRAVLGKRVPSGAIDGLNNSVSRRGRRLGAKTSARVIATTVNDIGPVRLPAPTAQAIAEFQPEVVHSLLGGVAAMRLALAVSRRFDVPILPHFMDDWPQHLFDDGRLWGLPRRAALHALDSVLRRSPVALTIGEDMRMEFEERFGIPCAVVGNSVDTSVYRELLKLRSPFTDPPVLRYVGGLHLGRNELVADVAKALHEQALDGTRWTLELHVPRTDAETAERLADEHSNVVHRGSLAPDDVPAALVSASAQLFVESSDQNIARFTRLSVSTKVPQYLAANRPILVVGNEDQSSVRTLLRSDLSVYAGTRHDPERLASAIRALDDVARRPALEPTDLAHLDVGITRSRLRTGVIRAIDDWQHR